MEQISPLGATTEKTHEQAPRSALHVLTGQLDCCIWMFTRVSSPLRWYLPFAVLFAPAATFPAFHCPARCFAPPLSPFPNPSLLSCCPRPDFLTVSSLPETTVAFLVMPGGKEHFLRSGARVSLTPLRSVLENRSFRHDLINVQLRGQLFTRVDNIPTSRYCLENKAEIALESPACI